MGVRGALQGLEEITFTAIHLFFYGLLGWHLSNLANTGNFNLTSFWDSLLHVKNNGLVNLVQGLARSPKICLQLALASPFIWSAIRATLGATRQADSLEDQVFREKVGAVPINNTACWSSELAQWLPMVSAQSDLQRLGLIVRWDGRYTLEQRQKAFTHIQTQALHGNKKFQRTALRLLAKIAHGFHPNDLERLKQWDYSQGHIEELIQMKYQSIKTLETLAQWDIQENTPLPNKMFTLFMQLPRVVFANYLLWWLGLPTSKKANGVWWLAKLTKLSLEIVLLVDLITIIQDALRCPQQPGFTFGDGFAPWAGDYTVKCFQERIRFFRSLDPNESVDQLVEELQRYHLRELSELSLNNKQLTWFEAQKILKVVTDRGAKLSRLEIYSGFVSVSDRGFSPNFLGNLPDNAFALQPDLQYLSLNYSGITDLANDTFKGLSKLQYLDLSNNQLRHVSGEVLSRLSQLTSLDLSVNQLSGHFNQTLTGLRKLTFLDLSFNSLSNAFAWGLADLLQLVSLDLGFNALGGIPVRALMNLTRLQVLYLHGNQILEIPPQAFASLSELRELNVGSNQLNNISAEGLVGLLKLQDLSLNFNRFKHIPAALASLPQLQTLDLGYNLLSNISMPRIILSQLQRLVLNNNQLRNIPEQVLANFPQLTALDLTSNLIENISSRAFLGALQLQSLTLYGNQLSHIPITALANLSKLRILDLAFNQFSYIPPPLLVNLSQLTWLDLDYNPLGHIPTKALATVPQLTWLGLSGTQLREILPQDLVNLPKLQNLFLAYNQLTRIAKQAFSRLYQLQLLYLQNNQLDSIPTEALMGLSQLEELNLQGNKIGHIDDRAFMSLNQLQTLYLDENQCGRISAQALVDLSRLQSLSLNSNNITDIVLYNLTLSLPASTQILGLNSNNITQQGLASLGAILPCTNLLSVYWSNNPGNSSTLNLQLQLKLLQKFCESQRCHAVWPNTQGQCHIPKLPGTEEALPFYFRTRMPEPPCYYKSGGANLAINGNQPKLKNTLLPECQLAQPYPLQRMSNLILNISVFAGVTELSRELLTRYYPQNKKAQQVCTALQVAPLLSAVYLENSYRTPVASLSGMAAFAALKTAGASDRFAYCGMLLVVAAAMLWFLTPNSLLGAGESLAWLGLALFVDSATRRATQYTARTTVGLFRTYASSPSNKETTVVAWPSAVTLSASRQ